ncbi:MAG: hypothetical protein QNJ63_24415 [Calothrix sp. MO_192.B10]|nr:hypothetical protein [Calothrix sp. MO_192.B10]
MLNSTNKEDKFDFKKKVTQSHGRVDPCFMTGQGCVYTEAIDRELDTRQRQEKLSGFMIVPFRPNIESFLTLCLQRYVERYYSSKKDIDSKKASEENSKESGKGVELVRGDKVRKTGYVICEKICKKIQESNFVIADISVPNPNVFYELGLAYGTNQKIIIIYHHKSEFGKKRTEYFGCKAYSYQDLKPIETEEFMISQFIWQNQNSLSIEGSFQPSILLIEGDYRYKSILKQPAPSMESETSINPSNPAIREGIVNNAETVQLAEEDIQLEFKTHILSAIDVAIEKILEGIQKGEHDLKKLSDEIKSLSDEIKSLSERIREISNKQNDKITKKIDDKQNDKKYLESHKEDLKKEKEDLKKKKEELKKKKEELENLRKDYKDKVRKHGISTYVKLIENLRHAQIIQPKKTFKDIQEQIQKSYCSVIRTVGANGDYDPMAYFWLGYCHALGKNVIPISVIKNKNDKIDDLAFDIRALWHMTFVEEEPKDFVEELQGILEQMIFTDFAEWSRKIFWDEMLGRRGKVSIFTGALHSKTAVREMIGDWDLRTASEMTSYFASHHYRSTIESPIYEIKLVRERNLKDTIPGWKEDDPESIRKYLQRLDKDDQFKKELKDLRKMYIKELKAMLQDKNCIIIASPDVNPLTEVALGAIYKVPEEEWFEGEEKWLNPYGEDRQKLPIQNDENQGTSKKSRNPNVVTAIKIKPKSDIQKQPYFRTFYQEECSEEEQKEQRGFRSLSIPNGEAIPGNFYNQISQIEKEEHPSFYTYAHLVIAPNPFHNEKEKEKEGENVSYTDDKNRKYILILNGISGPATFALTHVLTGGVSNEFVFYDEVPTSKNESKSDEKLKSKNESKSENDSKSDEQSDTSRSAPQGENIFFDPQSKSEEILQDIIQDLRVELDSERLESDSEKHRQERRLFTGMQYLIQVSVGPQTSLVGHQTSVENDINKKKEEQTLEILDWRRIKKWELAKPEETPSRLISDIHIQENKQH